MPKKAYRTSDGKLALLNTRTDECLWSGRWTNGRENNRFDELYVHITKNGKRIFYVAYITYWQGESMGITVLDSETTDVQGWLLENYESLSEKEIARLSELGVTVEEDA